MNCQAPEDVIRIVTAYLRYERLTIIKSDDSHQLAEGNPNVNVIRQAFHDRAVTIADDGSVHLCGICIATYWDTGRIRRKVENYLRKVATTEEIICIASCLGIKLS